MWAPLTSQTLLIRQAQVMAQSYLDQARIQKESENSKWALALYGQAKVIFRYTADEMGVLPLTEAKSALNQARTSQTAEAETLRQRIAEIYFERAQLLEKLGKADKAQASYHKAKAWGHLEVADQPSRKLAEAALPPTALMGSSLATIQSGGTLPPSSQQAISNSSSPIPAEIPSILFEPAQNTASPLHLATGVEEKNKLVNLLFKKTLETFQELKLESVLPSAFVVYAHDNPHYGTADDRTAKFLIQQLFELGINMYSDQTPKGRQAQASFSTPQDAARTDDILTSQLCLLPTAIGSIQPVDKVMVCSSQVLGHYLQWKHYPAYCQELKAAYGLGLDKQNPTQVEAQIRQVVNTYVGYTGFHHVLTEMAFLKIRAEYLAQHGIIPVSLSADGYTSCCQDFIQATTVRIEDMPRFASQQASGQRVYEDQGRHLVFFKVLERLLARHDAEALLRVFWTGYADLIKRLNNEATSPQIADYLPVWDRLFKSVRATLQTLKEQVDAQELQTALTRYASLDRLAIQRVSGEALSLEDCYVNLAIVESMQQREQEKKRLEEKLAVFQRMSSYEQVENTNIQAQIELKDLFNERTLRNGQKGIPAKILIQGRAGIGKSTLCKKLVYDFQKENGPWRDRFDAVLWLPLRQLKSNYAARNLENLLREKYFAQYPHKERLTSTFVAHSNRILFILDGLDEVSTEVGKDSSLGQFLDTLLNQSHIILTSRPSGVDHSILRFIDLELETIGFSKNNVQAYLQKVVSPEAVVAIQDFIQRTPIVQGLVNIPVQLDVLCYSWDGLQAQIKKDGSAVTMTSLYKAMIDKLLRNDSLRLEKAAAQKQLERRKIYRLESDLVKEYLIPAEEKYLDYLAFKGMQDNRIEFNDEYLRNILRELNGQHKLEDTLSPQLLDDLAQLSFLHTTDTDQDEFRRTWHFLHLTFQEFFAAKFLVKHLQAHSKATEISDLMLDQKQLTTFITENKYNPRYEIVWSMVAGFLEKTELEYFFALLEEEPRDPIGDRHQQVIRECLNEARNQLDKTTILRLEAESIQQLHFEINLKEDDWLIRLDPQVASTLINKSEQARANTALKAHPSPIHLTQVERGEVNHYISPVLSTASPHMDMQLVPMQSQSIASTSDVDHIRRLVPPAASLTDLRTALYEHYHFSIRRVSGQEASLGDSYVNLAIVESQAQRKKDKKELDKQAKSFERLPSGERLEETNLNKLIPLDQLFEKQKLRNGLEAIPKRILIQGRAGIGKATLCKKLVYEYLHDKLWQDRFDCVLWVPLRQLKTVSSQSFEDLLCNQYFRGHEISRAKALAKTFYDHRDKALFILDGLDQVISEFADDRSLLKGFLEELLNQKHVVITSRPAGVDTRVLESLDLELEIIGFSPENVQTYIQKFAPPSTQAAIQHFIHRTPIVQSLVNIPIQLDALCYSWDRLPKNEAVTMSILYEAMVDKLWRKDSIRLEKTEEGYLLGPNDIDSLSEPMLEELVAAEIHFLGYLALKGLEEGKIEFSQQELAQRRRELNAYAQAETILPLRFTTNLKKTSYLHTVDIEKPEAERHYHFLHLTFQEFFAAKFLVQHIHAYAKEIGKRPTSTTFGAQSRLSVAPSQEELEAFIATHKYDLRYEIVWSMVGGLLKGAAAEYFFIVLNQPPLDLIGGRHDQLMLDLLIHLHAEAVDQLEKLLMQRMLLEFKLNKSEISVLGQLEAFPEHLLLMGLERFEFESHKIQIIQTLGARLSLSEVAISVLIEASQDEYSAIRIAAAEALGNHKMLSENTISALIMIVRNDEDAKYAAAKALGNQNKLPENAISTLVAFLQKEKSHAVRSAAAVALGGQHTRPENVISALTAALQDAEWTVRDAAARALGNQNDLSEKAISTLIVLLKEGSNSVKSAAAKALSGGWKILSEKSIQALIVAIKNEEWYVKSSAAIALSGQRKFSENAISALITVLQNENSSAKSAAAKALSGQEALPESAIQALIAALQDEDWVVRSRVAKVLNRQIMQSENLNKNMLSESATLASIAALQDEKWVVRSTAVRVLSGQKALPEKAIDALITTLKHKESDVRSAAARVLSVQEKFSENSISAIVILLQKGSNFGRFGAAKALSGQRMLPANAYQALISALQDKEENVRSMSASVLDLHIDELYSLLPNLPCEQIQSIYTRVLYKKTKPLYIQDNQLYFYTATGPGQPLNLTPEQKRNVVRGIGTARAELGIASLAGEEAFPTEDNHIEEFEAALENNDKLAIAPLAEEEALLTEDDDIEELAAGFENDNKSVMDDDDFFGRERGGYSASEEELIEDEN